MLVLFPIVVAQVVVLWWMGLRAMAANGDALRQWVLAGDGRLSERCVAALLRHAAAAVPPPPPRATTPGRGAPSG